MKNIVIIVLALACAFIGWTAYQQSAILEETLSCEEALAKVTQLEEEIHACEEAAEASSAEAFILQQLAEKHKAEAEEHKQAAEEHKKIAEEHKKIADEALGKTK